MKYLLLLLGCFGLCSCAREVQRIPKGFLSLNQRDPALSGNGKKLALIVDQNGRPTVQLKDLRNGNIVPLRYLSRHQPHTSPSLSWSARYVAAITQRGNKRLGVIEDRLTGTVHKLLIPGNRIPIRLSLAPDGRQLAIQVADKGKWRVEIFDLSRKIDPDLPVGIRGAGS